MSSINPSTNPNTNSNPSTLSGHAQYAKGYVEETIGNISGNKEWQESGKKDAQEGVGVMRAAKEQRTTEPAASGIGGKIEEIAGKSVGCEGMEVEGVVRQEKAA